MINATFDNISVDSQINLWNGRHEIWPILVLLYKVEKCIDRKKKIYITGNIQMISWDVLNKQLEKVVFAAAVFLECEDSFQAPHS